MFEEIKARLRHQRVPLAGIELNPPITGWHEFGMDELEVAHIRKTAKKHLETFDFSSLSKPRRVPLEDVVIVDHLEE